MKRILNHQKGYSLVELLVAMAIFAIVLTQIFAMMVHSARLYKNGTFEVDLQTEAQQFVQQMEELLIDVNVSVNETGTPSSNYTIQIINTDQTYTVDFVKDDPAADFGEIRMSASGNIAAADMLMAEYVQSVSLDMAEYTSADKVVLCVSMNNGKYSYETSKDIYLRNGVGSGTGGAVNIPGGDFDEELDVLRFKVYDLTDRYRVEGVTLDFRFEDGTLYNDEFEIFKDVVSGHWCLRCKSTLNDYGGWKSDSSKYNILAVDHDNPSSTPLLKIQIGTKEVKVLPDGYGIAFAYKDNDEQGALSAVQVQGIDMTRAQSAKWTMYWRRPGGNVAGGSQTGLTWTWNSGNVGAAFDAAKSDNDERELRFDHLDVCIADIDDLTMGYNGLKVNASGIDRDGFQSAFVNKKGYYLHAEFKFEGCDLGQTFNINIFFMPSYPAPLSDTAVQNFWSMCVAADF